ncbi:NlpC/P60 family protein [Thermocrispum sp.]|uniref:NlpC/P60 family protein n=1 Tax=Thermocrispum sp. TaxID=2060768 RepID=UPI00257F73E3|nr:NlpC/P60 family protein [Thermocrispum sp.]
MTTQSSTHARGRRWLAALAVGVVLAAGHPAVGQAVPPPPPNPSDEELKSSRWQARKRAGEVGELTNRLAWATARLNRLRDEVARKQELANKARVDAQRAKEKAAEAKREAKNARNASRAAARKLAMAEQAKDEFVAGSYRQGSTIGGLSAYLSSDNPGEVLARAQVLSAVSASQLDAIEKLKKARIAKANADAAARKALQVAEQRKAEAEEAERAAQAAFTEAVEARKSQYSRTAELQAEKQRVATLLWRAQQKVRGLENQRQRYEEWLAAKRREEQLKARQAALNAAGNGGGAVPSGSSKSSNALIEEVVARAMSQIGVPYAWGGGNANGPTYGIRDGGIADAYGDYKKIGFDCSGLMIYAFAKVKPLPHYSGYQYHAGRHVPLSQARRGDMLFWGRNGIHHVALYLGNGQMIEAPQSGMHVRVTSVRYDDILPYATRLIE